MSEPDLVKIQQMAADAETRARAMAKIFIDRREIGDAPRALAEIAEIILKLAERSASVIATEDYTAALDQIHRWAETQIAKIVANPRRASKLRAAAVAELDRRQQAIDAFLAEEQLNAWLEAELNLGGLAGGVVRLAPR